MDKQKLGLLLADVGVDAGRVRELADALLEVVDALAHLVDARDDLIRHALEARLPALACSRLVRTKAAASRTRAARICSRRSVTKAVRSWGLDGGSVSMVAVDALRHALCCDWQLNLCCVHTPRL